MISSILVANRGEIACRIFRTARRLGIRTIAVYSEADAAARHVREADEAVCIGPAPARESYLSIERILEAARATGAQSIHPGYGFLSENAQFAQACVAANVRFIGPPASAIAAMGSKILAKARMRAVGVPVLPGYEGERQEIEHLATEARRLGMPLIIKPAAGGGGKGMRIVTDPAQLPEALAAARRLAESGFGDGALLLERYLPAPRHVEVQIFADSHGSCLYLGDRDCSIQRRHQKLIEEAPAPALTEEIRARLRTAALTVAREIGYVSAGTVEFLFDGRDVYFMEMNTRLQVEHTVTEAVIGLDLVEWQIRIAAGEKLPLTQEHIRLHGHAIEARVCAEDPERDFLPSAGELRLLQWPAAEQVRVDAGFSTGDRVPDTYDSLLGKVIAWGSSREEAATRLRRALEQTYCAGVRTNEHWLARIVSASEFLQVRHSIAFLSESADRFRDERDLPAAPIALAALATLQTPAAASPNPWAATDGFNPNLPAVAQLELAARGRSFGVEVEYQRERPVRVRVSEGRDGSQQADLAVSAIRCHEGVISVAINRLHTSARYFRDADHLHIWCSGEHYDFSAQDPRTREFSATASQGGLTTPLPGVVVSVPVESGQSVAAGEVLMVIEAMKMEHTITAPYAGTVRSVHFARGDRVPEGSELLELEPTSAQ